MPDSPAAVLITRPEPGASETATRVAILGFRPILAPLLAISPRPTPLPPSGQVQAILITSSNAIQALPTSHRHLPLFAVGDATAQRARAAGFERVASADGDAAALAGLVARTVTASAGPLLLATGRLQGNSLAVDLRHRGFQVVRRVIYAAEPVATLPAAAGAALRAGTVRAAMFFSAETARTCVRLLQDTPLHEAVRTVDALAIGKPAAVALEALSWRRVRVAARPDQDAMLALLR